MKGALPILSCEAAKAHEAALFGGDEIREWAAMQAAARALADALEADFREIAATFPPAPRLLVLVGKGHNGGDALLAAARLRERHPALAVDVVFAFGEGGLRPLATRALHAVASFARPVRADGRDWAASYDLCLDGVFGFQFRPPLPEAVARLLARVNGHPIRLRAAVDLPSGLDAPDAFRADFTYATGIAKSPLLDFPQAGRLRFLDLGFFNPPARRNCHQIGDKSASPEHRASSLAGAPLADCHQIGDKRSGAAEAAASGDCHQIGDNFRAEGVRDWVLTERVLAPLAGLRDPRADKRHHGHPLIVAGSRRFPGAALMATLSALQSGAGLVTAAVPESLVPSFAARVPEAIWIGLPETPDGGLALEGLHLVRAAFARATSLVLGPGLGRERETLAFAASVASASPHPLVIDADALQPEIVSAGRAPRVLTPHEGEYDRVADALPPGAVVVRKGPVTRIETVGAGGPVYHSFFGGPVLGRGGSGDLLAGLAGTLLAQTPADPLGAAARAVVWHGLAADQLARAQGPTALRITQLLDFFAPALRASAA
jgi:NAD(P)H-hydrate epimerase